MAGGGDGVGVHVYADDPEARVAGGGAGEGRRERAAGAAPVGGEEGDDGLDVRGFEHIFAKAQNLRVVGHRRGRDRRVRVGPCVSSCPTHRLPLCVPMRLRSLPGIGLLVALVALAACSPRLAPPPAPRLAYVPARDSLRLPGEVHLRNVRQLTFGGNNAEAYWSFDGKQLIFQSDWQRINPQGCDQQFVLNADGTPVQGANPYRRVSTGQGRTTCGYFLPDGRVLFASTHAAGPACPPAAGRDRRAVRVGDLRLLRHLHRQRRRLEHPPAHHRAGLRRRGDGLAGRALSHLHLHALGRPGAVALRVRYRPAAPTHRHAGLRRRRVLLARLEAHRVARLASAGRRPGHLPAPARAGPRGAQDDGAVRGQRRRLGRAPGDRPAGGQLGAVLPPGRQAHPVLVQPRRARAGARSPST